MQRACTRMKKKKIFTEEASFYSRWCAAVALLGHRTFLVFQSNTTGHFKCVIQNTLKISRMCQYSSMNKFHTSPECRVPEARFESLACCLTELRGSVYILPALHKALS